MNFSKKAISLAGILLIVVQSLPAQVRQTREEYIDRYKSIAVAHICLLYTSGLTSGLTRQLKNAEIHENSTKKKTAAFLQLSDFHWWEHADLNRRPPACRAGALNQLSYAPGTKKTTCITVSG